MIFLNKLKSTTLKAAMWIATVSSPALAHTSVGEASWYGPGLYGNRTTSGEVLRPGSYTAAHRYLPIGSRVRVTNLNNGRSVVVRINDRGPWNYRLIDLADGGADAIGLRHIGVAPVRIRRID